MNSSHEATDVFRCSGDRSRGQNVVPATRFFMKIERSHDRICRGDRSP